MVIQVLNSKLGITLRLMSPLSKDETRRDSSLALTISHYIVIRNT